MNQHSSKRSKGRVSEQIRRKSTKAIAKLFSRNERETNIKASGTFGTTDEIMLDLGQSNVSLVNVTTEGIPCNIDSRKKNVNKNFGTNVEVNSFHFVTDGNLLTNDEEDENETDDYEENRGNATYRSLEVHRGSLPNTNNKIKVKTRPRSNTQHELMSRTKSHEPTHLVPIREIRGGLISEKVNPKRYRLNSGTGPEEDSENTNNITKKQFNKRPLSREHKNLQQTRSVDLGTTGNFTTSGFQEYFRKNNLGKKLSWGNLFGVSGQDREKEQNREKEENFEAMYTFVSIKKISSYEVVKMVESFQSQ